MQGGDKSSCPHSCLSSPTFPWQLSEFRKVQLRRVKRGLIFNDQECWECGGVCLLARGWDHYREKARQGYDQDLSEGTDAVGSPGFVGFIPHICADGHVTTTLLEMGLRQPLGWNKCKKVHSVSYPTVQVSILWSFIWHTYIKAPKHTSSIRILFARGIFTTQIYSVLKPPLSLIAILDSTLNMHSFCMTHERRGDILTCICFWVRPCLSSAPLKNCVCVTFLAAMVKGLLENAKHIFPSKWPLAH